MANARSLRADDSSAMRAALRDVVRSSGVPVAFAGAAIGDRLRLNEFVGTHTTGLHNLEVQPGTGLGGRVLMQGRPIAVTDYGRARSITHDYDRQVLGEGLTSLLAVPVRTGGRCRAVLYGAVRERVSLGDRVREALLAAGQQLARQLAERDQAETLLSLSEAATVEELRSVYSELRTIASATADSALRERIHTTARRIARLGVPTVRQTAVRLSTRECDVLAQVALGCTNLEVAERLSLSRETVKAYLRSAMRKLDAHSRHEAVVCARKEMLLP